MQQPGGDPTRPDSASARRSRRIGRFRHPVNQALADEASIGQRVADVVTAFLGSWKFIVIQTVIVAIWVAGNIYLLFNFDPFPFIFLNLTFSTQAAYAAPLILLASNRAAIRDRMTLEHAAMQTDVEEAQNERLLNGVSDVLRHIDTVEHRILALEQRILELEQGIMTRITVPGTPWASALSPVAQVADEEADAVADAYDAVADADDSTDADDRAGPARLLPGPHSGGGIA